MVNDSDKLSSNPLHDGSYGLGVAHFLKSEDVSIKFGEYAIKFVLS